VQEEAALDLGATHVQTFRKILLPFLKPAIGSAAVLAFLASFENYNTTVFTILSESTVTTFLAAKVRHGINPSVSALAVSIVVITLLGAAIHEMLKRREIKAAKESDMIAKGKLKEHSKNVKRGFFAQPALYMILAVFVSGLGTTYFAGTMGVEECKVRVKEEKRKIVQESVRKQQQKAMFRDAAKKAGAPAVISKPVEDKSKRSGVSSSFGSMFSTDNLKDQSGTGTKEPTAPAAPAAPKGMGGGLFAPNNLKKQSGSE